MSEAAQVNADKPQPTPEPAKPNSGGSEKPTENAVSSPRLNLREQFKLFSKFGDTKSDGKHITLSQSDKWMKQAKVIDGKTITTTDTAIHFKKFKWVSCDLSIRSKTNINL